MDDVDPDRTGDGFRDRVTDARGILRAAVAECGLDDPEAAGRTERVPLAEADGRTLAERIDAPRNVPHCDRAAIDGYALRARDTFGASDWSPAIVRPLDEDDPERVASGTALRIRSGDPFPAGADAVVPIERVARVKGGSLEVETSVTEGEHVVPIGEDVEAGQRLHEPGRRLRPSDLGLLRSVGRRRVTVAAWPTVGVVPTGDELVDHARDPDPDEVVETNGLTVARLVERWGGRATSRDVVDGDREALRVAIQRDLTKDVVVTSGGSSVGERDLVPEVIDDLGTVLVHGVAAEPGRSIALGVVEDTPVLAAPGPPVACIVATVQFLRPLLAWLEGRDPRRLPTVRARLERKISSEPGIRTFARVRLVRRDDGEEANDDPEDGTRGGDGTTATGVDEADSGDGEPDGGNGEPDEGDGDGEEGVTHPPDGIAVPTRTGGAGVLSSASLADGWVVVADDREGIPAGEVVDVADWEYVP